MYVPTACFETSVSSWHGCVFDQQIVYNVYRLIDLVILHKNQIINQFLKKVLPYFWDTLYYT